MDELLLLDKFSQMAEKDKLGFMKERNAVFVPNRSFAVYVGYDAIEKRFDVPVYAQPDEIAFAARGRSIATPTAIIASANKNNNC